MIPDRFDEEGLLAAGEYSATLSEIRTSILGKGPNPMPEGWDSKWRGQLIDNLEIMAKQLWNVGVTKIFINGSFVSDEIHPHDIDGYFDCDPDEYFSRRLHESLNKQDPGIWIWDSSQRVEVPEKVSRQLPMWVRYHVELYADYGFATSGVLGPDGLEMPFSQLFRSRRGDFRPKGIIRLMSGGEV